MELDRPSATVYQFPVAQNSISVPALATEEKGSVAVPADVAAAAETKEPRGFLQSARRNLSEDELASPAGRRFLIRSICFHVRVFATSSLVSHARRAVATPHMVCTSVLTPCASELIRIRTPASFAARAWMS